LTVRIVSMLCQRRSCAHHHRVDHGLAGTAQIDLAAVDHDARRRSRPAVRGVGAKPTIAPS
jgi:hypothetical protein